MALSADELDTVARSTVDLYRAAEQAILVQVTRRLAAGQDATDWQAQRLGQLSSLRRTVDRILVAADEAGREHIRAAVAEAWRTGTGRATIGLPAALLPDDPDAIAAQISRPPTRVDVVESLAGELVSDIASRHRNVLRHVEDVYRSTIQQAVAVSVAGGQTRLQAAQHAYAKFVNQGVTGFVDVSGRHWRLSSYVEMGVRTVTQRAAVQGQTDRLQDLGLDLVIISDSPRECDLCRPWEGTVLSISGSTPTGQVELEHATRDDEMIQVRIDGTLDQARADGLFHPNCTHSARGYLPGVTRRIPAQANPAGDAAKQRQREIERKIRGWKERELGALDPAAAASARGKIRAWQGEMRRHLDANPELKRLRYREQIGAGNIPPTASGIANAPGPRPTLGTTSLPTPARRPAADRPFDERIGDAATELDALSAARRGLDTPDSLTAQQAEALRDYESAYFQAINGQLRRGEVSELVAQTVADIDGTMAGLARDVVAWRGLDDARRLFGARLDGDLTGMEWLERAYLSTTTRRQIAADFASDGASDRVLMRLLAPEGTGAVRVSGAGLGEQAELLLQRGLGSRVVADYGIRGGVRLLDVELVPGRTAPRPRLVTTSLPAPRPTPRFTGRATGRDMVDEIAQDSVAIYRQRSVLPWDPQLATIGIRQGFDALPRRGSAADLDRAIDQGWIETWRGVIGGRTNTAAQINDELRSGVYEPGKGLYGNGWYASVRRRTGDEHAGPNPEPDGLLRIALDPNARIIEYEELVKEQKAYLRTLSNRGKLSEQELMKLPTNPDQGAKKLFQDLGHFAAARGYDAIVVHRRDDGATYRGGEKRADQYVVLNRSIMMIQDAL